ncbi:hypothetical protein INT43_008295 [Umbelopsis isabellina]|uniref:BHLH domain-containing protein n=1 Tax=Mortierella isabellina TaxID=91625 RepID=A0A8H7PCV4_MORIS|nr:hypothetical protein INT43_008295 [Umbelopsis isabellina]
MNPTADNSGAWHSQFFSPFKHVQQQFMANFGPSWERQVQIAQQKRQAQMMLMNQAGNLMVQPPPPPPPSSLDMDMPISPTTSMRMTSPRKSGKVDRRAEHNAIERARRESLNVKFQQLAHALPNLQDDRRPSKSRIVEKALEWVRQTFHREQQYRQEIQQLRLENERLRAQLSKQTNLRQSSFCEVEHHSVATSSQHDTQIMPYSNWSSLSESYLFDPTGRPTDDVALEPQDDDDNSSNEGDYDYDRKQSLSFYGPLLIPP